MDRNRYRVMIDNPIDNTHAGIPMLTRTGITFGSPSGQLVAAVLVRETIKETGLQFWRVKLASHTKAAADDLMATLWLAGERAIVLPMIRLQSLARGTQPPVCKDASGNERRLDVQRAGALAESGQIKEARELLARHNLSYMAVEIVVGPDGERKVRQ